MLKHTLRSVTLNTTSEDLKKALIEHVRQKSGIEAPIVLQEEKEDRLLYIDLQNAGKDMPKEDRRKLAEHYRFDRANVRWVLISELLGIDPRCLFSMRLQDGIVSIQIDGEAYRDMQLRGNVPGEMNEEELIASMGKELFVQHRLHTSSGYDTPSKLRYAAELQWSNPQAHGIMSYYHHFMDVARIAVRMSGRPGLLDQVALLKAKNSLLQGLASESLSTIKGFCQMCPGKKTACDQCDTDDLCETLKASSQGKRVVLPNCIDLGPIEQAVADFKEYCAQCRGHIGCRHECKMMKGRDKLRVFLTRLEKQAEESGESLDAQVATYVRDLENAIRNLLMSADCSWEERDEGHEWPEACQNARNVLGSRPACLSGEKKEQ